MSLCYGTPSQKHGSILQANTVGEVYLVCVSIQVILLLIIIVMRNRIALVVALFHEAGKAIASMPSLLIQPLWTFLILLVFFFYWVIVLGFLSTAGLSPSRVYKVDFH